MISVDALAQLTAYQWPGNVRELDNVMQRAAIVCGGDTIEKSDLIFEGLLPANTDTDQASAEAETLGGGSKRSRADA